MSEYFIPLLIVVLIVVGMRYFSSEQKPDKNDNDTVQEPDMLDKYKNLSVEEIIFHDDIDYVDKLMLLEENCGYSGGEAEELLLMKDKAERKAKLRKVKRTIAQKVQEIYNDIPTDDRQPISDDVKHFVWQRDNGRCVKCSSQEMLEFDHIIPFSKGGSNSARNLQLLCQKCNREKSNNI